MDSGSQKKCRKMTGTVVSDKMAKTIVVKVETKKWNKLYKKQYKSSRKYSVHDEKEQYKVGDAVTFVECRPLSKHKRWRVLYKQV